MSLKTWVVDYFRDDVKHEEIAERERHSQELADGLRRAVERDGFGHMFAVDALDTHPQTKRRKGGRS